MSRLKILLSVLLVATTAGSVGAWYLLRGTPETIRLAGVVESQEVRLGSRVGGRVEKLLVAEGDMVQPGQVLAVLAIPEILAQRDQAKARVAAAQAARDRAYNGYLPEERAAAQGAYDAARARHERLLAGWRLAEQKQIRHELEAVEAELEQAKAEFERLKALAYKLPGAVSQKEMDEARKARDRAQAQVNSLQARVEMITKEGSRKEDIAEAAGEMMRTKAQLDLILRGIREEDKLAADAELAALQARLVELEALVAEAEIRILKTEDCWVKVFVPETSLGKVTKGQLARVTVDSHPNRSFAGKVTYIASISEFLPRNVQSLDERRNQMFAIKIIMTEPEAIQIFKPGMAAQVVLE
ncbi:MAG TPA: efflux RND transporter periplasmic adaptor subunit [Gemmatales bacterium]|nr:efflux RND transporter periplasmic adaptor subunit [Gemmatales bacterium]